MNLKYRHELKFEISLAQYYALRQALRQVCALDPHAGPEGEYLITSLYFDNCYDKALREKRHGLNQREKFRFRYYRTDLSTIHLEKKQKKNGLCLKVSCPTTPAACQRILDGDWRWLLDPHPTSSAVPAPSVPLAPETSHRPADPQGPGSSDTPGAWTDQLAPDPLLIELGFRMETQLLRPRTAVRYRREAYIYGPGNVRITFDKDITGTLSPQDFLATNPGALPARAMASMGSIGGMARAGSVGSGSAPGALGSTVDTRCPDITAAAGSPASSAAMILEVKYDEFLPQHLRQILTPHCTRLQSYSKYAACRNFEY